MKKGIYFILIFCTLRSFAQYVRIPDVHFREKLIQLYPVIFNSAGLMDTNSAAINTIKELDLSSASISNLEGIHYFKALKILNCASNNLRTLPMLPKKLQSLDCRTNQLSSLPLLPMALRSLDCSHNRLTTLGRLPSQLTYLLCENNKIRYLTNLPNSLKTLWAFGNCFDEPLLNPNPNLLTNFIVTPNGMCQSSSARILDADVATGATVYPNPAQDQLFFNITSKTATYRIFDAIGSLRLSYTGTDKTIDISQLSPGIYFVKIHSDAGDLIQKITKE